MGKKEQKIHRTSVLECSLCTNDISAFVTEWGNGEGVDINLDTPKGAPSPAVKHRDVRVALSWEQFEVLERVIEDMLNNYKGVNNG